LFEASWRWPAYFGPQRIKKIVGSTTTRYIYSGSKPIAEYVNGANVNSQRLAE